MTSANWAVFVAFLGVVVALGTAIPTWNYARKANKAAQDANDIAEDALRLAEAAEQRAEQLHRLQVERADVAWKIKDDTAGRSRLTLTNVGADTAHDVEVLVQLNDGSGDRISASAEAVQPGRDIVIDLQDAAGRAERRFYDAPSGVILSPSFRVDIRISWRSENGASSVMTFDDEAL